MKPSPNSIIYPVCIMCIMHIPWCSWVICWLCSVQFVYKYGTSCQRSRYLYSKLWRHAFYETFLVHFRPLKCAKLVGFLSTSLSHVNTGTGNTVVFTIEYYHLGCRNQFPQSKLACNFHGRLVICYFDMFSLSYSKLLPARHSYQNTTARHLSLLENCAWWLFY